jgi:hypothetical protein
MARTRGAHRREHTQTAPTHDSPTHLFDFDFEKTQHCHCRVIAQPTHTWHPHITAVLPSAFSPCIVWRIEPSIPRHAPRPPLLDVAPSGVCVCAGQQHPLPSRIRILLLCCCGGVCVCMCVCVCVCTHWWRRPMRLQRAHCGHGCWPWDTTRAHHAQAVLPLPLTQGPRECLMPLVLPHTTQHTLLCFPAHTHTRLCCANSEAREKL